MYTSAYLNALTEEGVIVVTVNDYLAKRDAEQMGMIHEFLGLKVGVVLHDSTREERQAAYGSDITYVTNNELGFDYLRDNMAIYKSELVLRNLKYCIIDEVDSVLIDEARTPLIISGQSGKSTKMYELCDILAKQLQRGEYKGERTKMQAIMNEEVEEDGDFIVNEKDKVVNLTEQGIHKVEQFFHIDNYADPENLEIQHNVTLALRAHNLMFRDKDYVVKDDVIKNIDANTSLEELKSKLNTNAKQFKLIKNGQEVDKISTGTILVLDNDRSYTLVVTGDINGDSYHNELDLTLLINHLLDRTLIQNEIESMASDMNDDGEIDIVDLSMMNKKTLN